MAYTNSPLVVYKKISPSSNPRNHAIDTISIHCMAGDLSVESCGAMFAKASNEVSSNYGIGSDGRIALYVEEKNRSWCTSSRENDHRAITIEVASESKHPYKVTDKAYKALVELCADICKRNGIKKLLWKGDKSLIGQVDKQNMTVHRWFANKSCCGDYLYNLHGQIAEEVNKKLGVANSATTTTTKTETTKPATQTNAVDTSTKLKAGTKLNLSNVPLFSSAYVKNRAGVKSGIFYVWGEDVINGRIRITNKPEYVGKSGKVTGYISENFAKAMRAEFQVKVIDKSLNIRKGSGTQYGIVGQIEDNGVYTIVETKGTVGEAGSWGRLKSKVGWISLNSCYVKIL